MRRSAVLLVLVAACSESAPPESGGAHLFTSQGCGACHGSDGSGGLLGPPLWEKKQHWTRASLMKYLRDPQAYAAKDARLAEQARTFTMPMPRVDKLSEDDLGRLADHVLSMP